MQPVSLQAENVSRLSSRARVVRHILRFGPATRAELARALELSKATLTKVVNVLLKEDVLTDSALDTVARSRRRKLQVNGYLGTAIGVELTADCAMLTATDLTGRILLFREIVHPSADISSDVLIAHLTCQLQELMCALPARAGPVTGVGVALAGLVDEERGISIRLLGLRHIDMVPLADRLAASLQLPVHVAWRAHAAGLGELAYGVGRTRDDFLAVHVDDGITVGTVFGGRLLLGESRLAGALGHMAVADNRRLCVCGNYGCVQTVASIPAILQQVRESLNHDVVSSLSSLQEKQALTFMDVVQAAQRGDRLALTTLEEAGDYLAQALANLIYTLNPGTVVFGGGITDAGELLLEPIRRGLRRRLLKGLYDVLEIKMTDLPVCPAVMGAAWLCVQSYLGLLE